VFETASDAAGLLACAAGSWTGANYLLARTEPPTQMSEDFASASAFGGYPTLPLVDLRTMTVLVEDCWDYPTTDAKDYEACVADHLAAD
jgi:hypothetical protein